MKKVLITIMLALTPAMAFAAGGSGAKLDHVKVDLGDQASLQNGAKIFVNYCLSCHSASYMRYNRMAQDIGLTEEQVAEYMGFITDDKGKFKPGALMKATINADEAKAAFNTVPPDLSVTSRSKGADWIYTYMRSFYRDDSKIIGVNNLVFPDVGMPHVLWELQGWQDPVIATVKDDEGNKSKTVKLELAEPGLMTPKEYDRAIRDLVNFLDYMGEPAKHDRRALGVKVIMFLLVFLIVAYMMKREFWKDVH